MKKLVLVISILFISGSIFAQTTKPIDGVLGFKFGAKALDVKNTITAKGGILNISESNYPSSLKFTNVSLGHVKAELTGVKFIDGKAYEVGFIFRIDEGAKTIDVYNDLVNTLTGVYGKGITTRTFKSPYADGDGNELEAIKSGNADISTAWVDKDNAIQIKIVSQPLVIMLTYQDGKLAQLAINQKDAKEKADF